jgi:hypothetical protein
MATTVDLSAYKATDTLFPFVITDTTEDITLWAFVMTIRKKATDVAAILTIPAVVTDGPNRKFQVLLTSAMLTLAAGKYVYDVQRTDPGSIGVYAIGAFTVLQEVRVP